MRGGQNRINVVIGQEFGRLKIVEEIDKNKWGRRRFLCECNCVDKTKVEVLLYSLTSGHTNSCGCFNLEKIKERNTKHGFSQRNNIDKFYSLWLSVKRRCYNKNQKQYKDYGGRGIYVCDEWLNDPQKFIGWCKVNAYSEGLEIDREDNDGPYSPENCRFVTCQVNSLNSRLLRDSNSSGYCGVSYHKGSDSFQARIMYNGKVVFTTAGFNSPRNAALDRDKFIIREGLLHKLNFPELAINGPL